MIEGKRGSWRRLDVVESKGDFRRGLNVVEGKRDSWRRLNMVESKGEILEMIHFSDEKVG